MPCHAGSHSEFELHLVLSTGRHCFETSAGTEADRIHTAPETKFSCNSGHPVVYLRALFSLGIFCLVIFTFVSFTQKPLPTAIGDELLKK
jgi:hypothetical protein